jgi:CheY-like chemotaxis protein
MATTTRTLLIVEDDPTLNTLFKLHCEQVLATLPHVAGKVEQAFDYEQASQFLATGSIDLISVDIALGKDEEGKTDRERGIKEASGMTLLQELQQRQKHPLALVVSGEMLQSYALDAYRKYGVLAFYQKARFNDVEYQHAIKAALYYLDAAEAVKRPESELDLVRAKQRWAEAIAAAEFASIRAHDFPGDMGNTIELALSRQTDSLTGLPNQHWSEAQLRRYVIGQSHWAMILIAINGFERFVRKYASQEESILFFVGKLLKRVREIFNDDQIFIGHLGHLEYTLEPTFILLPGPDTKLKLANIAAWIEKAFSQTGSTPFTHEFKQLPQSELKFQLLAKVITSTEYSFQDLHEVLDTLRIPQM